MEKNNVMLSLTSIQWADGERSETELLTRASIIRTEEKDIISYEDTQATGFEGSVTTITVKGSEYASIVREGTANSMISMEIGRKHFCQYGTPFGNMQLGVYTHAINNDLSGNGSLYLKYSLDLNSSHLSDNEIIMRITDHDSSSLKSGQKNI